MPMRRPSRCCAASGGQEAVDGVVSFTDELRSSSDDEHRLICFLLHLYTEERSVCFEDRTVQGEVAERTPPPRVPCRPRSTGPPRAGRRALWRRLSCKFQRFWRRRPLPAASKDLQKFKNPHPGLSGVTGGVAGGRTSW